MRKLIRIIAIILFIVGLGFFAYPIALREAFDKQANKAIYQFDQLKTTILQTDNTDNTSNTDNTAPNDDNLLYAELRRAMFEYNEKLYLSGQSGLIDQLSYEKPDFLL